MRMLLDNQLKTTGSTAETATTKSSGDIEGNLEAGLPFPGKLKGDLAGSVEHGKQREMVDSLEYINTKSRMPADVMEKCTACATGLPTENSLVYIPSTTLQLENEAECRALIPIMTGTFDGFSIPEAQGLDVGHMMQSIIKTGAAFKLIGKTPKGSGKKILLKIPIDNADLFESHYSIDDLPIGKVDIIGIYKEEVNEEQLRSSYEYFQTNGSKAQPSRDGFIEGAARSEMPQGPGKGEPPAINAITSTCSDYPTCEDKGVGPCWSSSRPSTVTSAIICSKSSKKN